MAPTPVTFIVPFAVSFFNPFLSPIERIGPRSLCNRASRCPSKKTETSFSRDINVIELARKRMKSNGVGGGEGSRNGSAKVVHWVSDSLVDGDGGSVPRRAKSCVMLVKGQVF